jgi:uncharacterized SAM-binding protein YcdF (DUF218 family)
VFFFLSKVLAIFIRPLTWIIASLAYSLFTKNIKRKKIFLIVPLVLVAFLSNRYISNRVMLWWEVPPVPMDQVGIYDVGVVFSGVTKGSKAPYDRVYFEDGADRVTHTLQLYKDGKLRHIIVSGGLGFQQRSSSIAAERLRSFLVMAGVPDSVITVEPNAINTYENAVNSAEILRRDFPNQKYLLITSAFHMKRSAMCLAKQGIEFDQFPAGYLTDRPTMDFDDIFIPRAESITKWESLIKEWVGIVAYRMSGYL